MIFVDDGKVSPVKFCVGEALEMILELLETEPGFVGKDMVDVDIGLFGVCRRRRRSRHEDEE